MHKMAVIEKEEVEFPACHLVAMGFSYKEVAPYFTLDLLYTLLSCIK